ncbi:hypothetical protein ACF1BS_08270 [Streptomyces sp. NPDC014748]|uniref:hypothetical protein n=1 Tax=Streptomyces sp. NPDC014748 TaxID=3364905 RepID=UPI0036F964AD
MSDKGQPFNLTLLPDAAANRVAYSRMPLDLDIRWPAVTVLPNSGSFATVRTSLRDLDSLVDQYRALRFGLPAQVRRIDERERLRGARAALRSGPVTRDSPAYEELLRRLLRGLETL